MISVCFKRNIAIFFSNYPREGFSLKWNSTLRPNVQGKRFSLEDLPVFFFIQFYNKASKRREVSYARFEPCDHISSCVHDKLIIYAQIHIILAHFPSFYFTVLFCMISLHIYYFITYCYLFCFFNYPMFDGVCTHSFVHRLRQFSYTWVHHTNLGRHVIN